MTEIDFRFSLWLLSGGPDRLKTMAALRQARPDLGLRAAKTLLESVPCVVMSNITMEGKDDARRVFLHIADAEIVDDTIY